MLISYKTPCKVKFIQFKTLMGKIETWQNYSDIILENKCLRRAKEFLKEK